MFISRIFKRTLIVILIIITYSITLISQNGFISGDGWGLGWGNTDYWVSTGFGSSYGKTYQNSLGNGNRYFRLRTEWGGNDRVHGPSGTSDIEIALNTPIVLQTWDGTNGKSYFVNVAGGANNYNYIFRTKYGDGVTYTPQLVVFQVQGNVSTVTSVAQFPLSTNVTNTDAVTVTSVLSGNLPTGQGVYLRYSIDDFATSSIVQMTGSGVSYSATIPTQTSGTTVKYYILTSGSGLTITHGDADWYTINGNTNGGNNYSYTVLNGLPAVTVSPALPAASEPITITFDATGTALDGVMPVYLHSGVSTTASTPTAFDYVVGNWGQDDMVGIMTNISGNTWQIVIPSIENYYSIPSDEDVFGLNFLFRNAAGNAVEDNNGSNYSNTVNPGNYFTITNPLTETYYGEVGSSFDITALANIEPTSWTLQEVDPITNNELSTLTTITGNIEFTYSILLSSTQLRKFKLISDFNGTQKFKFVTANGYNPVSNLPRPAWAIEGINYHYDDPTKATLILHTPTYTRYKKGTGTISGTSNTTPKNVVYVIGDFNNWTTSEAFKMHRDTDGWNGTTDLDGDDDRGDYWWIELSGLVPGQEYVFQYLIDGVVQVADPYTHKVSDPDDWQIDATVYPSLIAYPSQAADRASVLQTEKPTYTWTAAPFAKPSDNNLNIYELHFRDFTEEGTYIGAIERLDYLKGLGINAIHVMPVSEFEGNSSWGYNPNFYFAADKAYGQENDLKYFIDECHKRQILVFNDLVLNHSFYSNVMAKLYWNETLNRPSDDNPWFNPLHTMVADPAGWWGADWNHESEHTQKMMDRVLDHWLQEFHFDGFRFDFTKGIGQTAQDSSDPWASSYDQDRVDLLERLIDGMKARNSGSVSIFEHLAWASEDKVLADQGILMWSGVGHHNAIKAFVLGYNADDTNIYDSGIYNAPARDFTFANWMSYGESHDEERLAYELFQYYNGPKTVENVINRLKIGMAFNLLFPGPRMLWEFQELGYDYSINFNGRTGEKPVRWDYYDDLDRRELHRLTSKLFKIRNEVSLYSTTPDYGNIGLGAGNITSPRVMRLSSTNNKHVIVVANLDPDASHDVFPNYDVTGTWYKYNGDLAIDGSTINVTNTGSAYTLAPSEVLVFTNFLIDDCSDVINNADNGFGSLRDAIDCAPDGGTVAVDYAVWGQTISLNTPIVINKNINIIGFPSKNLSIDGTNLTSSVLQVATGKTVTINGFTVTCGQGSIPGRCLTNEGVTTISDVNFLDTNGSASSGSSVINVGSGQLHLQYNVQVVK